MHVPSLIMSLIKPVIITLIVTLMSVFQNRIVAQCSTHHEDLVLTSQEEVDHFLSLFPGCSRINTFSPDSYLDITIRGKDITNLNALSQLTSVPGFLIIEDCPLLTDISGLQNIERIDKNFIIKDTGLTSLEGLKSLEYSGGIRIQNNLNLISAEINSLLEVGSMGMALHNNTKLDECTVPFYKRAFCMKFIAENHQMDKKGVLVKTNMDIESAFDNYEVKLDGNSRSDIEYKSKHNSFLVPHDLIDDTHTFSFTGYRNTRKIKNTHLTIEKK